MHEGLRVTPLAHIWPGSETASGPPRPSRRSSLLAGRFCQQDLLRLLDVLRIVRSPRDEHLAAAPSLVQRQLPVFVHVQRRLAAEDRADGPAEGRTAGNRRHHHRPTEVAGLDELPGDDRGDERGRGPRTARPQRRRRPASLRASRCSHRDARRLHGRRLPLPADQGSTHFPSRRLPTPARPLLSSRPPCRHKRPRYCARLVRLVD